MQQAITGAEILSVSFALALVIYAAIRPAQGPPTRRWLAALGTLLAIHLCLVALVPFGPWHANGHDLSRWGMTRQPTVFHGFPQPNAHGQTTFFFPWLMARLFPWTGSFLLSAGLTVAGLAAFAGAARRLTANPAAALAATALLALHPFTIRLAPTGSYGPSIGAFTLLAWWCAERWRADPRPLNAVATAAAASLLAQVHAECLGLAPLALVAWIVARAPLTVAHLRQLALAAAAYLAFVTPRAAMMVSDAITAFVAESVYGPQTPTLLAWRALLWLFAALALRLSLPATGATRRWHKAAHLVVLAAGALSLAAVPWPDPADPFDLAARAGSLPVPLELLNTTLASPAILVVAAVGAAACLLQGGRALAWIPLPFLFAVPYTPVQENFANRVEWSTASLQAVAILAAIGLAHLPKPRWAAITACVGAAALLTPYLPWMQHRFADQAWASLLIQTQAHLQGAVAVHHHITPDETSTSLLYKHALEPSAALHFDDVLSQDAFEGVALFSPACFMALAWGFDEGNARDDYGGGTLLLHADHAPVRFQSAQATAATQQQFIPPLHTLAPCHHRPDLWECARARGATCELARIARTDACEPSPPYERADCAQMRRDCDLEPIVELRLSRINPHGDPFLLLHDDPVIGAYRARCGTARP